MRKNLSKFWSNKVKIENAQAQTPFLFASKPQWRCLVWGGEGGQSPKWGEETGFRQRYHVSCIQALPGSQSAAACCVALGRGWVQVSSSTNCDHKNANFLCPAYKSFHSFHSSLTNGTLCGDKSLNSYWANDQRMPARVFSRYNPCVAREKFEVGKQFLLKSENRESANSWLVPLPQIRTFLMCASPQITNTQIFMTNP